MLSILLSILAFAPAYAIDVVEDLRPGTHIHLREHRNDEYDRYKTGDRYEWTLYGARYDKPNYGHRFEWTKKGLSSMSICIEVDTATGGQKWRKMVDDEYCPQFETAYRWEVPFEGQESRCLKVDKLTDGQRFTRIVDDQRCAKPETVYTWEKRFERAPATCIEVDGKTRGAEYRKPAPEHLCAKTLDVIVAYGRKQPLLPAREPSRAPASVAADGDRDPRFREDPEDLVEHVHVHRTNDKIHQR